MKANFLVHLESFAWENLAIDRSSAIEDLALAIDCSNENSDNIWSHPLLYFETLSWGELYLIINFDKEERLKLCPWLTPLHQKTLAKIFNRAPSGAGATNLASLNIEFQQANNALLGLTPINPPYYVFDETSWRKLHETFIDSQYSRIDKGSNYFKHHYVPKLKESAGTIKSTIYRKQVHPIFDRLDTPTVVANENTLHGEQIQIHFKDENKSALNLNGVWKHGGFNIPNEAKEKLIEWGFKLPN